MHNNANDILASLRDTIWVLSDKQMYLTELIDHVKMFALRLIGNPGQYQLIVNENIEEDVLLEATTIVHLKAMLQEIIHNTLKHAQGDCIVFNIQSNDQLEINLSDNGIGFEATKEQLGNGLQNIHWRAAEIGCQLDVRTNEKGTQYRLLMKLPLSKSTTS